MTDLLWSRDKVLTYYRFVSIVAVERRRILEATKVEEAKVRLRWAGGVDSGYAERVSWESVRLKFSGEGECTEVCSDPRE